MERKDKKLKIILNFALSFSILIFAFCISLNYAKAGSASLYFSPSGGTYLVGSTFTVAVKVNTEGERINAGEARIIFNPEELQVISLSKTGSIFSLWTTEPNFSNSSGYIVFGGGTPIPFVGTGGTLINITFKAKIPTLAQLRFTSGSVLAADGQGTNILKSLESASFSLITEKISSSEATTPSETINTPLAPKISSSTHPDPNKWYPSNTAKFSWNVPPEVTAVRLLVGKIPQAVPTVEYEPPINEKEITNLEDGIWYFHVQFKNRFGWGDIAHFRFQIDTQPPEPFTIRFVDGKETTNPRPTVLFDTTDTLSGIDHYKIKISEGDFFSVSEEEVARNPYTLPLQAPGKRTILVQAFDRAGNYTTAVEEFVIKPLNPPEIIDYPPALLSGEVLIVKGKTEYPKAQVIIWIQKEKEEPKSVEVKSDERGNFTFVSEEKLKEGLYQLWAEVIDERGARSDPGRKVTIVIKPPTILKWGSQAVSVLAVIVPLVVLLIALLFIIWYGWHKLFLLKKGLRKETRETKEALWQAFGILKKEVEKQIAKLDGKEGLNERERKICEELKRALEISQEYIKREIEDIERRLK